MNDGLAADASPPPEPVLRRISANLREARQDAGLTLEELAERSELHLAAVERMENGTTLPHLDTLVKLAAALEVSPSELCAGISWNIERRRFE